MSRLRVKKGDKVVIIAGADCSNTPREVLQVLREEERVIVKDVNMRWKHLKQAQQSADGGRVRKEFPIDISNVQLYSEKAGKGVRVRVERIDGKRVRIGVPCGTKFD
ncbi:MAG: 50S ribosomal protein L24 [Planctomycetaceae bacterium]|jgi:large subunit ribosomal protein L24|nr:50S ribosomal protein L24 [Planctomycetaceae bacterium]MDP6928863.1 50S ribosomal protein L24 [Planctomycetota bacterium]